VFCRKSEPKVLKKTRESAPTLFPTREEIVDSIQKTIREKKEDCYRRKMVGGQGRDPEKHGTRLFWTTDDVLLKEKYKERIREKKHVLCKKQNIRRGNDVKKLAKLKPCQRGAAKKGEL